ncbi:hypothetical protein ACLBWT_01730 [Paenibacillus sp. D51F]
MFRKYLTTIALITCLVAPSVVSAKDSQDFNDLEIKKLHEQIFTLVSNGQENQVETLPLYQKYQEIFREDSELKANYLLSLEANKASDDAIEIVEKGNKTYEIFEDGSFSVLTNSINAKPLDNSGGGFSTFGVVQDTGEQYYTATSGQLITNDARHDIWGAYKTAELHLVTQAKIYSTSATITNTSTSGTSSWFPGGFSSTGTSISTNNARTVQSVGDYAYTVTCPVGWGVCASTNFQIKTIIDVKYAGNGSITFTSRSIVTD